MPESLIPSSLPRRFRTTSGVSAYCRTCGCSVFTFPNAALNLPAFARKSPGRVRNVMYPSSIPTSLVRERHEEVRAGVRVDDRLQADLGFLELEARLVVDLVVADEAEEVADDGDVRVEDVARLPARGAGAGAAGVGSASAGRRLGGRRSRREGEETEEKEFCEKEEGRGCAPPWIYFQRNSLLVRDGCPDVTRPERRRLRGRRRRAAGEGGKDGRGRRAVRARLGRRARRGRREEDGRGRRRQQVRDGAGRARVLVLRDEGRVVRVIGREELRPVRERLDALDVPERPAQRQRREQGEDGGAEETGSHEAKVYARRPRRGLFRGGHPEIAAVAGALPRHGAVVDDAVGEEGIGDSRRTRGPARSRSGCRGPRAASSAAVQSGNDASSVSARVPLKSPGIAVEEIH